MIPLAAAFELAWSRSATLRAHRAQLRTLLALFWAGVLAIYYGSRWGLLPAGVHYGRGVLRFASDSPNYHAQAARVAADLQLGSTAALLDGQSYLYSIILGVLYAVYGVDPLVGMLFNAVFYLAALVSVFALGRALFDESSGALAMWLVGLWPSFLLHETQTLRWVATTAGIGLVMTSVVLALGSSRFERGLPAAGVGYLLLVFDLPYMARLFYLAVLAFAAVLLVLTVRHRDHGGQALRMGTLGLGFAAAYYAVWVLRSPSGWRGGPFDLFGSDLQAVLTARLGFILASAESATAFANPRHLAGLLDFLLNLPEAYLTAFLAPYPGMLWSEMQGVSNMRHYVLGEMLAYYVMLPFVVAGVLLALRRLPGASRRQTSFVVVFTLGVYALLGTVVMSGGTLHRLRLPWFMIQCAFAAAALLALVSPWWAWLGTRAGRTHEGSRA